MVDLSPWQPERAEFTADRLSQEEKSGIQTDGDFLLPVYTTALKGALQCMQVYILGSLSTGPLEQASQR